MVEGRLQLDQWEDRNGGGQRSKLRVVAEQVQFMNRRPAEGGAYPPRENAPYQEGGSYGAPVNNAPYGGGDSYGAPRNSSYSQQDDVYAPRGAAPRDNGGYGRPDSGYDSYSRSVNPQAGEPMPPMPPQDGAEGTGMVDDIPF